MFTVNLDLPIVLDIGTVDVDYILPSLNTLTYYGIRLLPCLLLLVAHCPHGEWPTERELEERQAKFAYLWKLNVNELDKFLPEKRHKVYTLLAELLYLPVSLSASRLLHVWYLLATSLHSLGERAYDIALNSFYLKPRISSSYETSKWYLPSFFVHEHRSEWWRRFTCLFIHFDNTHFKQNVCTLALVLLWNDIISSFSNYSVLSLPIHTARNLYRLIKSIHVEHVNVHVAFEGARQEHSEFHNRNDRLALEYLEHVENNPSMAQEIFQHFRILQNNNMNEEEQEQQQQEEEEVMVTVIEISNADVDNIGRSNRITTINNRIHVNDRHTNSSDTNNNISFYRLYWSALCTTAVELLVGVIAGSYGAIKGTQCDYEWQYCAKHHLYCVLPRSIANAIRVVHVEMIQLHTHIYNWLWCLNNFLEYYFNPTLIFLLTNIIDKEIKEDTPFTLPFYGFQEGKRNNKNYNDVFDGYNDVFSGDNKQYLDLWLHNGLERTRNMFTQMYYSFVQNVHECHTIIQTTHNLFISIAPHVTLCEMGSSAIISAISGFKLGYYRQWNIISFEELYDVCKLGLLGLSVLLPSIRCAWQLERYESASTTKQQMWKNSSFAPVTKQNELFVESTPIHNSAYTWQQLKQYFNGQYNKSTLDQSNKYSNIWNNVISPDYTNVYVSYGGHAGAWLAGLIVGLVARKVQKYTQWYLQRNTNRTEGSRESILKNIQA